MTVDAETPFGAKTDREQALLFHARQRRLSHLDMKGLFRTHRFRGASAIAVPTIDTAAVFPGSILTQPVVLRAKIRITASNGAGLEPQGLICEFGSDTRGLAFWVASAGVAFRAGGQSTERTLAAWVPGGFLAVGLVLDVVACVNPNTGRCGIFINGDLKSVGASTAGNLGGGWADTTGGSFASAPNGNNPDGVTPGSSIAPNGFDVISDLSVYANQCVRHFR